MAVLALLSSRGNLSLQIFQAQYKIWWQETTLDGQE